MPCVPGRTGGTEQAVAVNMQGSSSLNQIRPQDEERAVLPEQSIVELSTKVGFCLASLLVR